MTSTLEGCKSLPDVQQEIPRFQSILIEGYNLSGLPIRGRLSDFEATIFQHEYDHLQGKLICDYS